MKPCPKCKSRATKIVDACADKIQCQVCDHRYAGGSSDAPEVSSYEQLDCLATAICAAIDKPDGLHLRMGRIRSVLTEMFPVLGTQEEQQDLEEKEAP